MIQKIINYFSLAEKILLVVFAVVFLFSSTVILQKFWRENTEIVAADGGEFLEG
jgi:cell division protein FtsL